MTRTSIFFFKEFPLNIWTESRTFTGVSRASRSLAKIVRNLKDCQVLDVGCGVGYMSLGALLMGAKRVTATDLYDVEKAVRRNLKLNAIPQNKLKFLQSDLFNNINPERKFDAIIANLPQHALPASQQAKKLAGKYGGYDGTDLVCRALTEGVYYLNPGGRFYTSVSELTNYRRTLAIINALYSIKKCVREKKIMHAGEMFPHLKDKEVIAHLKGLSRQKLIAFSNTKFPLEYLVRRYELVRK